MLRFLPLTFAILLGAGCAQVHVSYDTPQADAAVESTAEAEVAAYDEEISEAVTETEAELQPGRLAGDSGIAAEAPSPTKEEVVTKQASVAPEMKEAAAVKPAAKAVAGTTEAPKAESGGIVIEFNERIARQQLEESRKKKAEKEAAEQEQFGKVLGRDERAEVKKWGKVLTPEERAEVEEYDKILSDTERKEVAAYGRPLSPAERKAVEAGEANFDEELEQYGRVLTDAEREAVQEFGRPLTEDEQDQIEEYGRVLTEQEVAEVSEFERPLTASERDALQSGGAGVKKELQRYDRVLNAEERDEVNRYGSVITDVDNLVAGDQQRLQEKAAKENPEDPAKVSATVAGIPAPPGVTDPGDEITTTRTNLDYLRDNKILNDNDLEYYYQQGTLERPAPVE